MTSEPVVLDTDVASLSLKGKLPPDVLRQLGGRVPLITFVTLAELTRWVEQRQWGVSAASGCGPAWKICLQLLVAECPSQDPRLCADHQP